MDESRQLINVRSAAALFAPQRLTQLHPMCRGRCAYFIPASPRPSDDAAVGYAPTCFITHSHCAAHLIVCKLATRTFTAAAHRSRRCLR